MHWCSSVANYVKQDTVSRLPVLCCIGVLLHSQKLSEKRTVFPLGKRRPRTTQSMGSFRRLRQQDMKRVASAPVVVNSYRNQVKAGIVKAMLPRSDSSHMRSAFGAAEMWRSKLLTSRPSLEKGLSSKNS